MSAPQFPKQQNKENLPDAVDSTIDDPRLLPDTVRGTKGRLQRLKWKIEFVATSSIDRLRDRFDEERETGLLFNLVPVFMGVGICLYFLAAQEPFLIALMVGVALPGSIAVRTQSHGASFLILSAIAAVFVGMMASKLSALRSYTPLIERQITAELSGIVLEVDRNRRGSERMLIRPDQIDGVELASLPKRVRVSAANGAEGVRPGDQVTGLARLQPVSGPAYPGSYDFSFHAWFEGKGGSGFFMGRPVVQAAVEPDLSFEKRFLIAINKMRQGVENRIRQSLPDKAAGIVIALTTGNKSGIDPDVQESLRKTGLAHILAISGLHMALVTLTLIWAVRFGCAFFPQLVLHHPVKKLAVCIGFASATFYLLLSGGGIATQRAWITISVMLLAVLIDRRAVTMRSVAVSATIILLISPQSLFAPGFQMSFAAVAALVAGYEAHNRRRRNLNRPFVAQYGVAGLIRSTSSYFGGLALTSLIAGSATAFVAAWHFHQVAPLGLLANVLAMPFVALIVMPMTMISLLIMPFGFENLTLPIVAAGLDWVLAISAWVAGLSPFNITGAMPAGSLALFGLFLAMLTLFRTGLRLAAFLLVIFFIPFLSMPSAPDVLVAEGGRQIGLIKGGELQLVYPRSNKFVSEIWVKAYGGGNAVPVKTGSEPCDRERCIIPLEEEHILHVVYDPDLLRDSCNRADILIAPRLWWVNCRDRKPALVLKRHDFEQHGSHAITFTGPADNPLTSFTIKTGLPTGVRPWSRRVTPKD